MLKSEFLDYQDDGVELEAFVVRPREANRPIVILCHAWKGRDDFICDKAEKIADLGFVACALDMYGKGVIGKSNEESGRLKKPFLNDRSLLQKRVLKGYNLAKTLQDANTSKIGALGFGFGAMCALDLARAGVDLEAVISIYGHFDEPTNCPTHPIKAKVLIEHGYKDPVSPISELRYFEEELNRLDVDWQTHIYGNAYHAFATPSANSSENGLLYNPIAAARAWDETTQFLREVLY